MNANWAIRAATILLACAAATPAVAQTCNLTRLSDCCTVTIDKTHTAAVHTTINSAAQTNFTFIVNKGKNDCIYFYDGEIKVPMQSYVGSFNGIWLGGDFTLRYQSDADEKGTCSLEIYDMAIGYAPSGNCRNGRFTTEPLKQEEPEPATQIPAPPPTQ